MVGTLMVERLWTRFGVLFEVQYRWRLCSIEDFSRYTIYNIQYTIYNIQYTIIRCDNVLVLCVGTPWDK